MFKTFMREAGALGMSIAEDKIKEIVAGPDANNKAREKIEEMPDGLDIPLSTCDGNKKSLFIGINYRGSSAELRGCINDVVNIKQFVVEHWQFPEDETHMKTLTDDTPEKPTKASILSALKWLVDGAKPGDSLFFHYSGHGGHQKDTDGDEPDGQDETLIPLDYEKEGQIVDDQLHEILVAGLPEGVRLTAIMDCCHSGSVFDLPFTYTTDGNLAIQEVDNRKAAVEATIAAGMAYFKGNKKSAMDSGIKAVTLFLQDPQKPDENARKRQIEIRSAVADVIQFSGCRDEQTSADARIGGEATGAMSWAFRQAFAKGGFDQTYVQLLGNIRTILGGKYSQVPQMSTGHKMNMKTAFKM